jgi:hypothetical protein
MRNVRVLVIETKRRFSLNALDDQSDVPRLQTAQARRWTARCVTGHRSRGLVPFRLSVAVRQKLKKCVSYFLREGRLCQCVFSRRVDLGTAVNAKPVWAMDGTRIFSSLTVPGLCDTVGRYVYLFKRLMVVPAVDFTDSNT